MLRDGTLFILGAAVSAEVGFPLGLSLTREIADALPTEQGGADQIRAGAAALGIPYRRLTPRLKAGLPLSASIDNFVEHHAGDESLISLAKLGIAHCILKAERRSAFYISNNDTDFPGSKKDSSFLDLFRLIVGGVSRQNLDEALGRVSFVTFNYDRCLEHFFHRALMAYSGVSDSEARSLVRNLKIHHPYGSLGSLEGPEGIRFGEDWEGLDLTQAAKTIRTFSEEMASESYKTARAMVASAFQVIFLGCAPHKQNMVLIRPTEQVSVRKVFGTAYQPAPIDPSGNAAPGIEQFAGPTVATFTAMVDSWPRQPHHPPLSMAGTSFEPLTNRQLIARYGSAWLG